MASSNPLVFPSNPPHCASGRTRARCLLPLAIVLAASLGLLIYGPIAQLPRYHDFADQRVWLGLPHAADVLSNVGFALVGLLGLLPLWRPRAKALPGWAGYALFFVSLLLTAAGSSWYHLAPDNARLVFDRLPIALACTGLLAAVWEESLGRVRWLTAAVALFAVASVLWWRYTDLQGMGDLRPYLLLQTLPLVLIPLLQWQARRPRTERMVFALAIACYVAAKLCEVSDHAVLALSGVVSGHTLKHLLASVAAALVAWQSWRRLAYADSAPTANTRQPADQRRSCANGPNSQDRIASSKV